MEKLVVDALKKLGVEQAQIDDASQAGPGHLLALLSDQVLLGTGPRLNRMQVLEEAGFTFSHPVGLWRAMGFSDPGPDSATFTTDDADMLKRVVRLVDRGIADEEMILRLTRIMGRAAARVASAQVDMLRQGAAEKGAEEAQVEAMLTVASTDLLDDWEAFFVYLWRRHLAAAAERAAFGAFGADSSIELCIGFADLVGFTELSQRLDSHDLGIAVNRFERTATDTVSRMAGRTIKMIGDEVLFVVDDPASAAEIALRLVEDFASDDSVPDVRVGLSCGTVLPYQGDMFGPAVNMASRLVGIANPATVIVSETLKDRLPPELYFTKPIRARELKGIGRTRPWVLRRTESA